MLPPRTASWPPPPAAARASSGARTARAPRSAPLRPNPQHQRRRTEPAASTSSRLRERRPWGEKRGRAWHTDITAVDHRPERPEAFKVQHRRPIESRLRYVPLDIGRQRGQVDRQMEAEVGLGQAAVLVGGGVHLAGAGPEAVAPRHRVHATAQRRHHACRRPLRIIRPQVKHRGAGRGQAAHCRSWRCRGSSVRQAPPGRTSGGWARRTARASPRSTAPASLGADSGLPPHWGLPVGGVVGGSANRRAAAGAAAGPGRASGEQTRPEGEQRHGDSPPQLRRRRAPHPTTVLESVYVHLSHRQTYTPQPKDPGSEPPLYSCPAPARPASKERDKEMTSSRRAVAPFFPMHPWKKPGYL
eukprot:COSAG04_NODE_721_length_10808_cov_3.497525_6_plen_358_part_00